MRRHRADLISLGFGLFFLILAAWWSVNYYLHWRIQVNVPNFGWILAGALIVVGVLGVVASLRGDRDEAANQVLPDTNESTESGFTAPTDTAPTDTERTDTEPTNTAPTEPTNTEPTNTGPTNAAPADEDEPTPGVVSDADETSR
jgi:hypothetical protein